MDSYVTGPVTGAERLCGSPFWRATRRLALCAACAVAIWGVFCRSREPPVPPAATRASSARTPSRSLIVDGLAILERRIVRCSASPPLSDLARAASLGDELEVAERELFRGNESGDDSWHCSTDRPVDGESLYRIGRLAWTLGRIELLRGVVDRARFEATDESRSTEVALLESRLALADRDPIKALRCASAAHRLRAGAADPIVGPALWLCGLQSLAHGGLGLFEVTLANAAKDEPLRSTIDHVLRAECAFIRARIGPAADRPMLPPELDSLVATLRSADAASPGTVESIRRIASRLRAELGDLIERGEIEPARRVLTWWRDLRGKGVETEFLELLARIERRAAVRARTRGDLDAAAMHLRRAAESWYLCAGVRERAGALSIDDRLQAARAWEEAGDNDRVKAALWPVVELGYAESLAIHRERVQLAQAFATLGRACTAAGEFEIASRVLRRAWGEMSVAEGLEPRPSQPIESRGVLGQAPRPVIVLDPAREEILLALARVDVLSERSRADLAMLSAELAPSSPRWKAAVYQLGLMSEMSAAALHAEGRPSEEERSRALEFYALVVRSGYDESSALWWLRATSRLATLANDCERFDVAAESYERLHEFPTADVRAWLPIPDAVEFVAITSEAAYFYAEMLWRSGDGGRAIEAFHDALTYHADSVLAPWGHLRLGQGYFETDRPVSALAAWSGGVDCARRWLDDPTLSARSRRQVENWVQRLEAEIDRIRPTEHG